MSLYRWDCFWCLFFSFLPFLFFTLACFDAFFGGVLFVLPAGLCCFGFCWLYRSLCESLICAGVWLSPLIIRFALLIILEGVLYARSLLLEVLLVFSFFESLFMGSVNSSLVGLGAVGVVSMLLSQSLLCCRRFGAGVIVLGVSGFASLCCDSVSSYIHCSDIADLCCRHAFTQALVRMSRSGM